MRFTSYHINFIFFKGFIVFDVFVKNQKYPLGTEKLENNYTININLSNVALKHFSLTSFTHLRVEQCNSTEVNSIKKNLF